MRKNEEQLVASKEQLLETEERVEKLEVGKPEIALLSGVIKFDLSKKANQTILTLRGKN